MYVLYFTLKLVYFLSVCTIDTKRHTTYDYEENLISLFCGPSGTARVDYTGEKF